jgi:protease-4
MPQSFYYLATVADQIYLNPVALFEFVGLRSEVMFYKGAFDKLGIDMQIIRHGAFKSAVEPYIRKDMSSESRAQLQAYVQSVWDHMLSEISESRSISIDELNQIADQLAIRLPGDAMESGLVDGIKYRDEVIDELKERTGIDRDKSLKLVGMSKYSKVPMPRDGKGLAKNKIAVVYASGIIGFGDGSESAIGGNTFVKAFRAVRKDSMVKAIVLRINSPGGSAMVSEHIWREIKLASETKPLIVSMGNLAASGGYYIAAPADVIVSQPTTLTGSIGVLATIPNLEKLMNEKLGLTFDVVKTNEYSDLGSLYRPLKPAEKAFLVSSIENTYEMFLNRVSEGRDLEKSYVDEVAQGRIWSGLAAREIGLVDEIGGLQAAVRIAAEKSNIDDFRTVEYPKFEDPFEKILKSLSGDVLERYRMKTLGRYYQYFIEVEDLAQTEGIQARLPFHLEIY